MVPQFIKIAQTTGLLQMETWNIHSAKEFRLDLLNNS